MPPKSFDEVIREKQWEAAIKLTMAEHERENPLKPGFQRIYEDHTYRNYTDVSDAELAEAARDPFMMDLQAIIQEEVNRDIVQRLKDVQHERIVAAVKSQAKGE
ncbi:MAG: hypothetical protein EOP83_14760 [Verrucomicrobiaceae bacterium]|nr:MAG: hypothetical protein EOP83_14760 [Verrucomicrobiaceae bacterium]